MTTRRIRLRPSRRRLCRRPGTRGAVAASALAALLAAGCATVASPLPRAARPLPITTAGGDAAPAAPAAPDCGNPEVSLRPPAVLPAPGAMPAGSYLETIAKRGFLTVGMLSGAPPFGSLNPNDGTFEGFDVDIAKEIAKAIFGPDGASPQHLKFRAVTTAERIPVIRNREADIVVATMTTNCQRRTLVDFSVPYYQAVAKVLVLKHSSYRSLDDLGGRKVCAPANTTSLQHIADAPSNPIPVGLPNDADCLLALQSGEVDGILTDDTILIGMAQQDPQTRLTGSVVIDGKVVVEPDAVAVSLDHPDLTRFVNGVLARIARPPAGNGRWDEIADHWLGSLDPPLNPAPAQPPALYRD
jgi:polar amino acid transport system substrate-binding protein